MRFEGRWVEWRWLGRLSVIVRTPLALVTAMVDSVAVAGMVTFP